jgi:hypothetical protein
MKKRIRVTKQERDDAYNMVAEIVRQGEDGLIFSWIEDDAAMIKSLAADYNSGKD